MFPEFLNINSNHELNREIYLQPLQQKIKTKSNAPQIFFSIFSIPLIVLFELIGLRKFFWGGRMFLSQNGEITYVDYESLIE